MSTSDGTVIGTTKIVDNGSPADRWNLVLMGDGYTSAQIGNYENDVQDFLDLLQITPPFDQLWNAVNVYRVNVESDESGADEPNAGITRDTYFDATYGAGGLDRLLTVNNATALTVAGAQVPQYHMAMVIVNNTKYGGSGGAVATFSTNASASQIGIHEMGHTAFGLADEYNYWAGCGVDTNRDNYPGGEPSEPNVTINTDRNTLKWRRFVRGSTAIPTTANADCTVCDPQPNPVSADTIGIFEGARYYHCGVYRPAFNCYMRNLGVPFCAVCRSTIRGILSPFKPVDVYMRDNLLDTGEEPLVGGGISQSPDINHYRSQLADPNTTLGSAAAQGRNDLFETLEEGQTNYIYARMQNKGTESDDVEIDIYWTPPSTLPTPASWNFIGTINAANVAPGSFRVEGPLAWNSVPTTGHYCFVGVLGTPKDPKPDISTITTLDKFLQLVRESNNVVWKNFDVEDVFPGGMAPLEFHIQGWPRIPTDSDLVIELRELPAEVNAELKILKRITESSCLSNMNLTRSNQLYRYYQVNSGQRARLSDMGLSPSDDSVAILTLEFPQNIPDGAYDISVIQEINGAEVGRVIRRINVGQFPFIGNRRSLEVHRANCPWVPKMSGRNKVAYMELQRALDHGYDGCHTCLLEYDHG